MLVSAEGSAPERSIRTPAIQSRDPLVLVPGGPPIPWPPDDGRFTAEAKLGLAFAQDESVRLAHNHVGPVHLLVGIACADEGIGSLALRELGVSADGTRNALASLMGSGPMPIAPGEITLILRAQRVLDIAVGRSRQRGKSSAASEDVLLALIDEGEHFTTQLMRALGIEPDAVRKRLLELIDEREK
jgi:ATP-dependent Clp protease ATP-binding subunit ClpA